ncbi:MAG TPA: DJ-1 family protein [Candidatus Omnitrophica bacterium]|nr:DJ-1 family protein [Candidatus Omnitrophota bacterium]
MLEGVHADSGIGLRPSCFLKGNMRKEALLILAERFEEVEAVTPVDVLRRAGVNVVMAGLRSKNVRGSRRVVYIADMLLSEYQGNPDVLILPGGVQGAENLHQAQGVTEWIAKMNQSGKWIAAICAAPAVVLAPTGVLDNRKATCYPGYEKGWGALIQHQTTAVAVDQNIITSQGPGTALDFSFVIVEKLFDRATAVDLAQKMVYSYTGI